ncbi:MAG: single-stranded DNA-binding protein [Chlorobiota bacterium]|jgi:single-strand DNA-binding protein|nr:MAG: single-stranded DNA-binding protein [Chlorobiota bacterium]
MARTLNKVMLIGNVGRDPEIRYTPSGVPVASIRLATNEYSRDSEGQLQEYTEWHSIVAWRQLAEMAERLIQQGTKLYVEGRIRSRSYEDSSGTKRTSYEIIADSIIVLSGRKDATAPGEQASDSAEESTGGDVPF